MNPAVYMRRGLVASGVILDSHFAVRLSPFPNALLEESYIFRFILTHASSLVLNVLRKPLFSWGERISLHSASFWLQLFGSDLTSSISSTIRCCLLSAMPALKRPAKQSVPVHVDGAPYKKVCREPGP